VATTAWSASGEGCWKREADEEEEEKLNYLVDVILECKTKCNNLMLLRLSFTK
jgi:hypothetical protein